MLQPLDSYNQSLIARVHPPDWVNPIPQDQYDLIVIGAGTADSSLRQAVQGWELV